MNYYIVSSGFNCSSLVEQCYDSLLALQGDFNWSAILIADGCENSSTYTKLVSLKDLKPDERISISHTKENYGAAFHRYHAITDANLNDDDVIILLGLDDYLMPNALHVIEEQYNLGKWMTYGNWISQNGEIFPADLLYFDESIHNERSYRWNRYRSTAVNTFKKFLFNEFKEDDFKYDGKWIKATTESNLMLSCLEMCGKDRIGVIEEPIYVYIKDRIDNAKFRFGRHYQDDIYKNVKGKPKRNLLIR